MKTSETTGESNAVLTAISSIMSKVGSIEKRGQNKFHGYDYATAADILHRLQPLLAEHGLVIIPTQKEIRFLDDQQSILSIDYEFSLYLKDGSSHPERPVISGMSAARNSKGGFDDKAANKCLTAANKYFLLNLFKIATGDYDDADSDDDKPAASGKPAQPATISAVEAGDLKAMIVEANADLPKFLKAAGVMNVDNLPSDKLTWAMAMLRKKIDQAAPATEDK